MYHLPPSKIVNRDMPFFNASLFVRLTLVSVFLVLLGFVMWSVL